MLQGLKKMIRNNQWIGPFYLCVGKAYRNMEAKWRFDKKKKAFQEYGIQTFQLVINTLNGSDIAYFPAFGTLLGLVRDGKLIPHDFDFDFGVITQERHYAWEKLTHVLEQAGFQIVRWFECDGVVHEMTFSPPISPYVEIDFFAFTRNQDKYEKYACVKLDNVTYNDKHEFSLLKETLPYFNQFQTKTCLDVDVPIPVNAEELLAASYTVFWKKPNPNWKDADKPNDEVVDGACGILHYPN